MGMGMDPRSPLGQQIGDRTPIRVSITGQIGDENSDGAGAPGCPGHQGAIMIGGPRPQAASDDTDDMAHSTFK